MSTQKTPVAKRRSNETTIGSPTVTRSLASSPPFAKLSQATCARSTVSSKLFGQRALMPEVLGRYPQGFISGSGWHRGFVPHHPPSSANIH